MEKVVKVDWAPNGIKIEVVGANNLTIKNEDLQVTGEQLFNLLDVQKGDSYRIERGNNISESSDAFDFFYNLLEQIIECINQRIDTGIESSDLEINARPFDY